MRRSRLALSALALLKIAAARAQGPVGTWTGRFVFGAHVGPPNATPAQRTEIARRVASVAQGRLVLDLKRDGGYVIHAIRLPSFGKPVQTGTWKRVGSTVLLKDPTESAPRAFVLDPTGKRMTLTPPR